MAFLYETVAEEWNQKFLKVLTFLEIFICKNFDLIIRETATRFCMNDYLQVLLSLRL